MKQKKTNHYLLGTVFCLLLLLLLTPGQATKVQAATDNSLIDVKLAEGIRRYDYAYEVLNLVNQERAKSNLQPVTMDKNLLEHAAAKSPGTPALYASTSVKRHQLYDCFPYFGYNSSENLAINQVSQRCYELLDEFLWPSYQYYGFWKCICRNRMLLPEWGTLLDTVLFFSCCANLFTAGKSEGFPHHFRTSGSGKYQLQRNFPCKLY